MNSVCESAVALIRRFCSVETEELSAKTILGAIESINKAFSSSAPSVNDFLAINFAHEVALLIGPDFEKDLEDVRMRGWDSPAHNIYPLRFVFGSEKDPIKSFRMAMAQWTLVSVQSSLGLSCITETAEIFLLNGSCEISCSDFYLNRTRDDLAKFRLEVERLTNLFLSQFFASGNYVLWEGDGLDGKCKYGQTLPSVVRSVSGGSANAWISTEKCQDGKLMEGDLSGSDIDLDPDRFTITFEMDESIPGRSEDDSYLFRSFTAQHVRVKEN